MNTACAPPLPPCLPAFFLPSFSPRFLIFSSSLGPQRPLPEKAKEKEEEVQCADEAINRSEVTRSTGFGVDVDHTGQPFVD